MRSVLFAGGGSMGHVMVHFAVYPLLKDYAENFYYIGSKDGIEKERVEKVFPYYGIDAVKFDRSDFFKNFGIVSRLIGAIKQAKKILSETKPDVVFCGGGFVCVPVCIAAKKLGIPVILHESDYSLGLANRISLKFSEKLITTFPPTKENDPKTICAGPAIRRGLLDAKPSAALKKLGLQGKKPVLLVVGGSKGSAAINECVVSSLDRLLLKYEVLHICGSVHSSDLKKEGYRRFGYLSDMASAYAAADIAISRCGSNTAFELIAANIPTLFIPLSKKASRGDQIENAKYFEKNGLAEVLREEKLDEKNLFPSLDRLENYSETLKKNMKKYPVSGADERIANVIKNYL